MNTIITALVLALGITTASCANRKQATTAKQPNHKALVVYFSATGNTAEAARKLASSTGATLLEIQPEKTYTAADLDWNDHNSRSYREMHSTTARPAIKKSNTSTDDYRLVFIGYPIWWDEAPRIVNTFIENHDLKGKTVVPFATSGGSTIDNSAKLLRKAYPDINWKEGRLLNGMDEHSIGQWAATYIQE